MAKAHIKKRSEKQTKKKSLTHYDIKIFTILIFITVAFGLLMVFSSSSILSMITNDGDYTKIFFRQATLALFAGVIGYVASTLPAVFWWRTAEITLGSVLLLQILVVATPLGVSYGGNTNWLRVGDFTFQPSEFLKIALIIWIAKHVEKYYNNDVTAKTFFMPIIFVSLASIGLVLAGRDLGTALIILLIILGTLYFSGVKIIYLLIAAAFSTVAAVLYAFSGRGDRIAVWLNGCSVELYETSCWQIMHGQWALAEGGIMGTGLGNSKSKWSWLPHAESDYIYAIIGEEAGFVGAILTLLLFVAITLIMIRMSRNQSTIFGKIIISGTMSWFIVQGFVNIAVVLQLLPVLGVTLPFISAGGSSIIANIISVGIVISIAKYNKKETFEPLEHGDSYSNNQLYFWRNIDE
jgi:cell division protein FtsW